MPVTARPQAPRWWGGRERPRKWITTRPPRIECQAARSQLDRRKDRQERRQPDPLRDTPTAKSSITRTVRPRKTEVGRLSGVPGCTGSCAGSGRIRRGNGEAHRGAWAPAWPRAYAHHRAVTSKERAGGHGRNRISASPRKDDRSCWLRCTENSAVVHMERVQSSGLWCGVPPYPFGNSDDGSVAFRLHLWERVAVETGGALGNGDARAEWPAAGGTESPRGKGATGPRCWTPVRCLTRGPAHSRS